MARKCEIQLVYAIGIAEPVSIYVDTFGTSPYSEDMIIDLIRNIFDLRSSNIISHLGLNRPIYKKLPPMDILAGMKKISHRKSWMRYLK